MKKIQFLAFCLLLSSATYTSCDWFTCKDALALCDLVVKSFTAPTEVIIGSAFDVVTEIANTEDEGKCTTTEFADATTNLLEIFLGDGQGNWMPYATYENISQQGIAAGDLAKLLKSITINQSGDYRMDYYSDYLDTISERNDNNNYGSFGRMDQKEALKSTNNHATLYLKVLPLPNGATRIPGKPIIELNQ